ncbi:MAG: hypothetical protein HY053_03545 [Proteobacteria bacterium]|nr:hypothetical protein [Pseudomonadota bacterium]
MVVKLSAEEDKKQALQRLRFYKTKFSLERLVDLHHVLRGDPTEYIPEFAKLSKEDAKILYNEGLALALSDIIISSDVMRAQKCSDIVLFAAERGNISGFESLFISSMSVLQSQGLGDLAKPGFELIDKDLSIDQLSGDNVAALIYAASGKKLYGVTTNGINQMLGSDERGSRMGPENDLGEVIQDASKKDTASHDECVRIAKNLATSGEAFVAMTAHEAAKVYLGKSPMMIVDGAVAIAGSVYGDKLNDKRKEVNELVAESLCSGKEPAAATIPDENLGSLPTSLPKANPLPVSPPAADPPNTSPSSPSSSGPSSPPTDGPSSEPEDIPKHGGGHAPGEPEEEIMPVHPPDGDPDRQDPTNTPQYVAIYGLVAPFAPKVPGRENLLDPPPPGPDDRDRNGFDVSEWPRIKQEGGVDWGPLAPYILTVEGYTPEAPGGYDPKFNPKQAGDPIQPPFESGPIIVPEIPDKGSWLSWRRWRGLIRRDNG